MSIRRKKKKRSQCVCHYSVMLLWCTPSDFPVGQLPFLPVAQKNVKNKTPSIAYCFFCILFQRVLLQLEQYLRRRKGKKASDSMCTIVLHIIIIVIAIIVIISSVISHPQNDISLWGSWSPPPPPWHNVKPRLPLHPVRRFSVTTERIRRKKKTVISSIIIVFYLRKVWREGVITTRGWCTCTGVSCTFFFFFVGDLYIDMQVASAGLCDYYINLWIEWVPNMLEHDKTPRYSQGIAGTLIEWGSSDSLIF